MGVAAGVIYLLSPEVKKHIFASVWVNDNSVFADLFYRVTQAIRRGVLEALSCLFS
jgi:hypothetical protein